MLSKSTQPYQEITQSRYCYNNRICGTSKRCREKNSATRRIEPTRCPRRSKSQESSSHHALDQKIISGQKNQDQHEIGAPSLRPSPSRPYHRENMTPFEMFLLLVSRLLKQQGPGKGSLHFHLCKHSPQ